MKRLALLSLLLVLNGCAIVDIYKQARWDNNEYALVNDIQTEAELGIDSCADQKAVVSYVNKMYNTSVTLKNYTKDVERNQESTKMSGELLAIIKGLKERYSSGEEVSQKYCELKFTTIQTSTTTIKKSLGAKPR
jgi:uncharacterized sodium:solute symporter family permease YidK